MNILSVHNRYLLRGGEDESSELENSLLKSLGHNVVQYVADNHDIGGQLLIGVGLRSVWNPKSYRSIRQQIRENKIDLVKVDNFFPQISPAVFYAAKAENIPTVQCLRNFRLTCPGAIFFRDGKVCEDCMGKLLPWPGVVHGCYRQSRMLTVAPALMASVHRLAGTWHKHVSAYVALSRFSRDKFVEAGIPKEKIFVKPNFVMDHGAGSGDGKYALYAGRLSPEKGIDVLLSAWKMVGPQIKLKIIGSGPLEEKVRESAALNPAIELLGQRSLADTYELMGKAQVFIFPSLWYETFGRTIAEAFARGTPVIASKLGTMQTMVSHGKTGLHFAPGDAQSLADQVRWMLAYPDGWREMRDAARREYLERYTPERNYQMMMEIFDWARARYTSVKR